jgi:hypothetical protein
MAFSGCTSLVSASLPLAGSIGQQAFSNCTRLVSTNLPLATSIGDAAFSSCSALETVSLPATPPSVGSSIFYYTGSDGTITITVPAGAVSAYTSAWGVSAETANNGNTSVYGSNHKAVVISE